MTKLKTEHENEMKYDQRVLYFPMKFAILLIGIKHKPNHMDLS